MISNQNSQTSLRSFNVLQKLGQGSFASVYKVQRIDDGKIYAMKKAKIGQMKQKQRDNALNQVRVLASITHPNIINYKQAFYDQTTQSLCIVMEYADDGDIQKKINLHIKNHTHFSQIQIWQALIQMTKGLRALHEINILHRDLKCANVFCTKDYKYKLGDLNVSKVAKRGMARTQTGTPYYTSPQVWKDRPYDSKCDIWSLGCVIYQMASLSPPFKANNLKQLYTKIQRGIFQRIPMFYSDDLAQLINLCLKVNPSSRPSALQILQHPKIITNTPISQKYAIDSNQTKKVNLINTILCPRNLKSLKMALPSPKYQQVQQKQKQRNNNRPNSIQDRRNSNNSIQRVVSAKNLIRPIYQLPRVISSPYLPQSKNKDNIRNSLQRKPSSQRIQLPIPTPIIKQPISQSRQKQKIRQYSRNNNNRVNNLNKLIRNNSAQILKKRRQSSRSLENQINNNNNNNYYNNNNKVQNYRQRSSQKKQDKNFVEDISNRCKNIKDRVQMLMANRQKQQRYEKIAINYQRKYLIPYRNSKQKRQPSVKSGNSGRRDSLQIKQNIIPPFLRKNSGERNSSKSLKKNNSIQRDRQRVQRQNSQKYIQPAYISPYRR